MSECIILCARFREKLGVKTVKALKRNNNGVTHAAVDMLCALMCVSISQSTERTNLNLKCFSLCVFMYSCCFFAANARRL